MDNVKPITSFRNLKVYQSSYSGFLDIHKFILPKLPLNEKYDLKDQLSRSTKAIPRLIAEGYGKRHQKAGFQKYIDDAIAECNETIVGLEQIKDLYHIEIDICLRLIDLYDKTGRQLYKLSIAWSNFKKRVT